jgi:hypothetical protein
MSSSSPILHPSIRERREPKMSATTLAEYLVLKPDKQENVLHNSRFQRGIIVSANGEALRALRSYNCDYRRDRSLLNVAKAQLTTKSEDLSARPKARDEARRCLEALNLFERNENALGLKAMALRESPKFDPINIEGVLVSIRPDFIVDGPSGRVGAGLIRVAKAPDPADCKMDETRRQRNEHRREMGKYLVALLQLVLEAQGRDLGTVDRHLCFVADVRLGERIGPALDHAVRLSAIYGACRQIASLWPDIKPRPALWQK